MKQLLFNGILLFVAALASERSLGQDAAGSFQPLNDRLPPGYNAEILRRVRDSDPYWLQPLRVHLPTTGRVAVHNGESLAAATGPAPAQFAASPGYLYRLHVSDLPEFPGVSFYPSVELLDRLHPPTGREHQFPVPVILTEADLQAAAAGLMVTRVIYLENPRLAASDDPLQRDLPLSGEEQKNAVAVATELGRPMAIIRLGSRQPAAEGTPTGFFGNGGQIGPSNPSGEDAGFAKMSSARRIQQVSAER